MYLQVKNIEYIRLANEFITDNPSADSDKFVNDFCQNKFKRNLSKLQSKDAKKAFYYVKNMKSENIIESEWLLGSIYVYDRPNNLHPVQPDDINAPKRQMDKNDDEEMEPKPKKIKRKEPASDKDIVLISPDVLKYNLREIIDFPHSLLDEMKTFIQKDPNTKKSIVVTGPPKCGKSTFIKHAALKLGMQYIIVGKSIVTNPDFKFEQYLNQLGEEYGDLLVHFNFKLYPQKVVDNFVFEPQINYPGFKWVLVYECSDSATIRRNSDGIMELPSSNSEDRQRFLTHFLGDRTLETGLSLEKMARDTPGFSIGEIKQLCEALINDATKNRNGIISQSHFKHLVLHGIIKQPAVNRERVTWDDIAGHEDVKANLKHVANMLSCPSTAEDSQIRPEFIIMHGPPGCGKTMLAKALANELGCNFIVISASEVLSKYQGESEKNIRELFTKARNCQPTIMFIDEFDALGSVRDDSNNGSKNSIVNTFLMEIDGMSSHLNLGVFVIVATNRLDQIDPALSRSKRLGKHIEVNVPKSSEQRLEVLRATARNPATPKFEYKPEEPTEDEIFQELCLDKNTKNWSHSDLASLITTAFAEKLQSEDPTQTPYDYFKKAFLSKGQDKKEKYKFSKEFLNNIEFTKASDLVELYNGIFKFNEKLMEDIDITISRKSKFTKIINLGGRENSGKSTLISVVAKKHKHNLVVFKEDYFNHFDNWRFAKEVRAFAEENGPTVFQIESWSLTDSVMDKINSRLDSICEKPFRDVVVFFEERKEDKRNHCITWFTEDERIRLLNEVCAEKELDPDVDRQAFLERSKNWRYMDFARLARRLEFTTNVSDSILAMEMELINELIK